MNMYASMYKFLSLYCLFLFALELYKKSIVFYVVHLDLLFSLNIMFPWFIHVIIS